MQGNKNNLITASLTQSDIENAAEYSGQSIGIGGGYVTKDDAIGKDQKGDAQVVGAQVPEFSATPPLVMHTSDDAKQQSSKNQWKLSQVIWIRDLVWVMLVLYRRTYCIASYDHIKKLAVFLR